MNGYNPTPASTLKADLLKQLTESMGEFAAEMAVDLLPIYLEDAPGIIDQMTSSIQSDNADDLREYAHALKGSSANMGFRQMVNLALELEIMGKTGEVEKQISSIKMQYIQQEMMQIQQMVQEYFS